MSVAVTWDPVAENMTVPTPVGALTVPLLLDQSLFPVNIGWRLGFGIGASVFTNNVAALAALANGLLPMRRVAQLEAERRHILEMELRQSGILHEAGRPLRQREHGAGPPSPAARTVAGVDDNLYRTAFAAD